MIKNKKADIPIVILVIGVLAICSLALISFYSSSINVKNSFVSIGLIEKMNSEIEERGLSNHFIEKKTSEWSFSFPDFREEKLLISIEYNKPNLMKTFLN